jgi:hypothetical protein
VVGGEGDGAGVVEVSFFWRGGTDGLVWSSLDGLGVLDLTQRHGEAGAMGRRIGWEIGWEVVGWTKGMLGRGNWGACVCTCVDRIAIILAGWWDEGRSRVDAW